MPYEVHEAGPLEFGIHLGPHVLTRWATMLTQPVRMVRSYRREDLSPDLAAGLTVALVALPQAIAYASIANLPPHFGLYAAIVAGITGSLWGSSRHLSTGPTNAASILMLSVLAPLVVPDSPLYLVAASLMAVLVGGFRLMFGFAGLGVLINFVSRAVLVGFTAGAAILIAINQLPIFLGLARPEQSGSLATLATVVHKLREVHLPSLAVGAGVVIGTLLVNRFFRKLPGSMVTLIAATALMVWLGAERLGIAVVGDIPKPLPQPTDLRAAWTFFENGHVGQMLIGALAISLLGLVEAISIARTIARATGQRLDVNQEFVGQGLSNIFTGLFSGYTCSGSFTRSAVNYQAGARTQMAGVFCGIMLLAATLVMAPYLAFLPRSAVAGVILLVAYGMVDRESIQRIRMTSGVESATMVITFAATILFPLEFAVLSGVIFSLAMYVYRASLPAVFPVVPDPTFRHFVKGIGQPQCPQLAVMNIRGALFFGATQHVEDVLLHNLAENPEQKYLLLRMHGVSECDFTGIEMLEGIVRTYRERGGDVFMVQVRAAVFEIMKHVGFDTLLGEDHFLGQEEAIDYLFESMIDPARCWYECEFRVFAECQALPKVATRIAVPPARHAHIDPTRRLNLDEVKQLVNTENPILIDVREPEEYHYGHFAEAINRPLSELLTSEPDLPRDRPILLICRTGRRSRRAMRYLLDLGFDNVFNLRGGILSWKASDLPLVVD
jgi:SulP family sulfate permease